MMGANRVGFGRDLAEFGVMYLRPIGASVAIRNRTAVAMISMYEVRLMREVALTGQEYLWSVGQMPMRTIGTSLGEKEITLMSCTVVYIHGAITQLPSTLSQYYPGT